MKTSLSEEQRFWLKVNKTNTCWFWTASKTVFGYGNFTKSKQRQSVKAHRYSYELNISKIPKNMLVLHTCDNPSCVNPKHLWLGTQKENIIDCINKGRWSNNIVKYHRSIKFCPKGHKYDKKNTYINPKGHRSCRTCERIRSLKYYHEHKQN